ncbi:hypothetical protein V498_01238 [Pseudogymnoascus sp. VKM F-4517 (FW-2822)]|nr:hypothetical protein V498_01238 [Pseudogymnoascus sp. VKM F-4517 (FW-2822)]
MTSEAELRARYQTSRFREAGREASPIQADEGSVDSPQAPIIDTAEQNISSEEEPRGLMADQHSSADEEDPAAANTNTRHTRADEEDPAIANTDTEPIRVDGESGSVAGTQVDDSPALDRLSLADESLGNPANLPLPATQPSTPDVPSSTPLLSNEEETEAQTVAYGGSGPSLPSGPRSPVDPDISTLALNQSGDIPAQSSISTETGTSGTVEIEDGTERLISAENVDSGQLDGTTCSTRRHRHTQGSDSDSEQRGASISQRDENEDTVSGTAATAATAATGDDETTVNAFFYQKAPLQEVWKSFQPPVSGPATALPIVPPGRDTDNLAQFGGTKVRLCNPCVPDPNTLPPQPQRTAADERWRDAPPTYYLNSSSRPFSFGEQDMENLEREASATSARSRAVSSTGATHRHHLSQSPYPPRSSSQTSYLGGSSYTGPHHLNQGSSSYQRRYPNRNLPAPRHQSHQSLSMSSTGSPSNVQPHYRSLLDPFAQQSQSSTSGVDTSRPLPPIPRIREEDECPVCHRELPSRALPDFETLRSNHVTDCIEEQIAIHSGRPRQQSPASIPARHERPSPVTMISSSSSPSQVRSHSPNSATSSSSSQGDLNLAQAINLQPPPPDILSFPNTPEGRTAFREAQHAAVVLGHARSSSQSPLTHPSTSLSSEPRRTDGAAGVFVSVPREVYQELVGGEAGKVSGAWA